MTTTRHYPVGVRSESESDLRLRNPASDSASAPTYERTDAQRTVVTTHRHPSVSQRARCKRGLIAGEKARGAFPGASLYRLAIEAVRMMKGAA